MPSRSAVCLIIPSLSRSLRQMNFCDALARSQEFIRWFPNERKRAVHNATNGIIFYEPLVRNDDVKMGFAKPSKSDEHNSSLCCRRGWRKRETWKAWRNITVRVWGWNIKVRTKPLEWKLFSSLGCLVENCKSSTEWKENFFLVF